MIRSSTLLDSIEKVLRDGRFESGISATGDARETSAGEFSRYRGHPVFWPLASSPWSIRQLLVAITAGVVPVLISPRIAEAELQRLRNRFPGFGRLQQSSIELPDVPAIVSSPVRLAFLTSGSTDVPRVVAATIESLTRSVEAIHEAQRLHTINGTHVCVPVFHAYGFVNQLLWGIHFDRPIRFGDGTPAEVFSTESEMTCLVGRHAFILPDYAARCRRVCPHFRVVNFAGGPFPLKQYSRLKVLFPNARIINNYGCTEALPRLACREVVNDVVPAASVGHPIPGVRLRIEGDHGCGKIQFHSASAAVGLLNGHGEIHPFSEWIDSGDVGQIKADGLYVMGRHDDIANVDGERLNLSHVRQTLLTAPGIEEAHCWIFDAGGAEEQVMAALFGSACPDLSLLRQKIRESLCRAAWPRTISFGTECPTLPGGKPDRKRIEEMAGKGQLRLILNRSPR